MSFSSIVYFPMASSFRAALFACLYVGTVAGSSRSEEVAVAQQEAFAQSLAMIIATELGDKTFFIAALLSSRGNSRGVFLGAASALVLMTVLSATIGVALPVILSQEYSHWAATGLFLYFGCRHLHEAFQMLSEGEGSGPSGELQEVERSLKEGKSRASVALEAFVLTFLAEWGDKSQVATVALAAAKDAVCVILGGVVGHTCCTSLAVIGGKVLASRISERAVIASAGVLFLTFAMRGIWNGPSID